MSSHLIQQPPLQETQPSPQDYYTQWEKTKEYLLIAAEQGYAPAQYEMGKQIHNNDKEQHSWYLKAAMQGNAFAQEALIQIYTEKCYSSTANIWSAIRTGGLFLSGIEVESKDVNNYEVTEYRVYETALITTVRLYDNTICEETMYTKYCPNESPVERDSSSDVNYVGEAPVIQGDPI